MPSLITGWNPVGSYFPLSGGITRRLRFRAALASPFHIVYAAASHLPRLSGYTRLYLLFLLIGLIFLILQRRQPFVNTKFHRFIRRKKATMKMSRIFAFLLLRKLFVWYYTKKVKITVLERLGLREKLAEKTTLPDQAPPCKCDKFEDGQEIIYQLGASGVPDGFCDWAWNDIFKDILAVCSRASMAPESERAHVEPAFTCCTDGYRPVIFKIEPYWD